MKLKISIICSKKKYNLQNIALRSPAYSSFSLILFSDECVCKCVEGINQLNAFIAYPNTHSLITYNSYLITLFARSPRSLGHAFRCNLFAIPTKTQRHKRISASVLIAVIQVLAGLILSFLSSTVFLLYNSSNQNFPLPTHPVVEGFGGSFFVTVFAENCFVVSLTKIYNNKPYKIHNCKFLI
jgi:hypothetical protein